MNWFIAALIFGFVFTNLYAFGERGDNRLDLHLFSFLPVFNIVLGVAGAIEIVKRIKVSKGRCTLGHKMTKTFDSEKQKNQQRMRGVPIRASVGGSKHYNCTQCPQTETAIWCAF